MINGRGVYEIYNQNTPNEKIIHKQIENEEYQIELINLPTIHLDEVIENNNPIKACKLYKTYLENLIIEAKERFLHK